MNCPKNLPEKYASAKFTYSPVVEVILHTDRTYVVFLILGYVSQVESSCQGCGEVKITNSVVARFHDLIVCEILGIPLDLR